MTPRRALLLLSALLGVAAGPSTKHRWNFDIRMNVDQMNGAPPAKPKQEREHSSSCIADFGPAEIKDIAGLMSPGEGENCRIKSLRTDDGTISFTASCPVDEDGVSFDFDGAGSYDERSIRLSLHGTGSSDDETAVISGTLDGVRAGPCQ